VEKALSRQTFQKFEWIVQEKTPTKEGNCWSLNHDYNLAIKKAKGNLIVSWQDFTYSDPTTLERLWTHYTQNKASIVSGVGNKYSDDSWLVETWHDPRIKGISFHGVPFSEIEANLCSFPRQALYDVGGFNEEMDKYYGLDAYDVLRRINGLNKYKFYIDETIKSYSLEHGRPDKWDELNWLNQDYAKQIEKPPKNYLI
jgi:hypothetical protein